MIRSIVTFTLIVLSFCVNGQTKFKKDVKDLYKRTYNAIAENDSVKYKDLFLPDTSGIACANQMQNAFIIYPSFREVRDHLKEVIANKVKVTEFEIFDNSYLDSLSNPEKPTFVNVYSLEIKFYLDKVRMRGLVFSMAYYKDKLVYLSPPAYSYTVEE